MRTQPRGFRQLLAGCGGGVLRDFSAPRNTTELPRGRRGLFCWYTATLRLSRTYRIHKRYQRLRPILEAWQSLFQKKQWEKMITLRLQALPACKPLKRFRFFRLNYERCTMQFHAVPLRITVFCWYYCGYSLLEERPHDGKQSQADRRKGT